MSWEMHEAAKKIADGWYSELEEGRKRNAVLGRENAKLRDELDAAKHDLSLFSERIVELGAENAKLRELVSGLEYCVQGYVCDSCPLYDPSGTNHRRCESLERELGIEVDE